MKLKALIAALVITTSAAGCVKKSTYRAKEAELATALDEKSALEKKVAELDTQIKDLTAKKNALEKEVEVTGSMNAQMEARLKELGQSVESLEQDKVAAAQRLEELRRQKAAAEARVQVFRDLLAKLKKMIDNGQLKVVIRDGRMVIALPNDILFESGKTDVKKDGQAALANVATVLATIPDRRFLVAGHTDNVPIKTSKFPSNWELSTARAVVVTQFLVSKGMSPKVLAAAGYSEFDPVAANDTPEHQAQNRRIEIVLQPNLSDLPPLDDL